MNWFQIAGLISTIAIAAPVILMIFWGYYRFTHYRFLLLYCFLTLAVALQKNYQVIQPNIPVLKLLEYANNLLDLPLMLCFLMLFSGTKILRNRMKYVLTGFVAFEIIATSFFGFTFTTLQLVLAPTILIALVFSSIFFNQRLKTAIRHQKATGKAYILASLIIAYGSFAMLYIFFYALQLHKKGHSVNEIYAVYYFATVVYNIVLSVGLYHEIKRLRQYKEAVVTRRELNTVFNERPTVVVKKTAGQYAFD